MSGGMGGWATPGIGTERTVTESEILWGADQARNAALWKSAVISGTTRDAGNTNFTAILRPGLILGKIAASNEYEEWNADVATGTQHFAGVLDTELRAQDFDATNQDRVFRVLVARAPVKSRKLLIEGAAFIGHVNEFLARRQMASAGFVFDDDPQGYLAGLGGRVETITAEDHTLVAADNGKTFVYTHTAAAASAITLPAIKPGLEFNLLRGANSAEDFVITSAEGDNMIVGNDMQADSVTWTTTGQMIGAGGRIRSMYVGTDLRWHFDLYTPPFGTGLTGGFAYAIATA